MGSFKMDVKKDLKKFEIFLEGMFTPQDAMDFMSEFQKNTATFNPKEFELAFDAANLKVSPQDMLPLLEQCMLMYKQLDFKKITLNMGSGAIVKNQVRRVVEKVGLLNAEIV